MARQVNGNERILKVTAGNIRHNHINIRGHFDFFPSDCYGPSKAGGNDIEIVLRGFVDMLDT